MTKFDLDDIDTGHFLETLQIRNLSQYDFEHWVFSCPFSGHAHGDENPSARMRDDDTRWICYSCKRSGNALTFLAEYEGVSNLEAHRWLREQYGGSFREPITGSVEQEWIDYFAPKPCPTTSGNHLSEDTLDRYITSWEYTGEFECPPHIEYMKNRGFDADTLIDWEIGYDGLSGRITIPIRNEDGKLIGIKARSFHPDHEPKYLALGDKHGRFKYGFPTYEKSKVVFGLNKITWAQTIVLCEGELNVVSAYQKGFTNFVAIAGSSVSEYQAQLIRERCDRVVLFFDDDEAGNEAIWGWDKGEKRRIGAVELFEPFISVAIVGPHESDPAEMNAEEIENLILSARSSLVEPV